MADISETAKKVEDRQISVALKALAEAQRAVAENPSRDNLAKLKSAEGIYAKAKATSGSVGRKARVEEILEEAKSRGLSLGQAKVFRDIKSGKLFRASDGTFSASDVEAYFKTLRHKGTPPENANVQSFQTQKDEAELRRLKAVAEMAELKLQVAKGQVIPRDQFISEMASRLIILREGFRLEAESHTQEIIAIANGNPETAAAVARYMSSLLDAHLANYGKPIKFKAVIDEYGEASFVEEDDE